MRLHVRATYICLCSSAMCASGSSPSCFLAFFRRFSWPRPCRPFPTLSDFGLAVQLEEKYHYVMKGNAGTSGYLAPEVWAGEYYGISPDVWSFGITIYELLHGRRPYRRWNPHKNYIEKMKFHPNLSSAARGFIRGLLTVDPRKRLACGPSGWSEVKAHPFFAKIDWSVPPPARARARVRPFARAQLLHLWRHAVRTHARNIVAQCHVLQRHQSADPSPPLCLPLLPPTGTPFRTRSSSLRSSPT